MDELEMMKTVADALGSTNDKDVQKRVLTWAWSKYVGGDIQSKVHSPDKSSPRNGNKKRSGSGSSSKKSGYEQVKTLTLKPKGKISLEDFVKAKNPSSLIQKVTAAVYYMKEELEESAISISHVYTCFKWMKWKLPSDLKNTLHQAGAQGLMDTRDGEDLKLTPMGENLVEHDLGKSATA